MAFDPVSAALDIGGKLIDADPADDDVGHIRQIEPVVGRGCAEKDGHGVGELGEDHGAGIGVREDGHFLLIHPWKNIG